VRRRGWVSHAALARTRWSSARDAHSGSAQIERPISIATLIAAGAGGRDLARALETVRGILWARKAPEGSEAGAGSRTCGLDRCLLTDVCCVRKHLSISNRLC